MKRRCKLMFVSSAGGHLAEMLRLQNDFDGANAVVVTERTPTTERLGDELKSKVLFLPHGGREALLSFSWKFTWNILISFLRVAWYRPLIVISTGAHTAVPTCILAKMLGAKIIYIESFALMQSPSLTGRILHPFVDRFYIQWPDLKRFYKKASYKGKIF